MNPRSYVLVALLVGCGGSKLQISEVRMTYAPSRPANCSLDLVQVDITAIDFNQKWDTLGQVALLDTGLQDPSAPANRALVRPRACAMGGTAIAVGISGANTNNLGQTGSGITYMVLRPKAWAQPPQAF